MSGYFQIIGGVIICVVLALSLDHQGKELTVLLILCASCMVLVAAASYWKPVMDLINRLQELSGMDPSLIRTVMKVVGVGIVGQLAQQVCADSGNSSLAKAVEILASAVILGLSVPIFEKLLELTEKIVGEL